MVSARLRSSRRRQRRGEMPDLVGDVVASTSIIVHVRALRPRHRKRRLQWLRDHLDRGGRPLRRYIAEGQTSKQADDSGGHKFHDNVHNGQPGTDDHGTDFDKSVNEEDRCDTVE